MTEIATKLSELYAKLQFVFAADRELDVLIGDILLRGDIERDDGDYFIAQHGGYPTRLPWLTSTVDSAQILIPKEWFWTVGSDFVQRHRQIFSARVAYTFESPRVCRIDVTEEAPTLALALCKAVVKFYIEYLKEFPQEPS